MLITMLNFVESMLDVFMFVVRACMFAVCIVFLIIYIYVINYEKSHGLLN